MPRESKESKENKANETEEKALQTRVPQSIDLSGFEDVVREGGVTGLEDIDQTDLKLPKVKLIQMQSEEHTKLDIPVGHYYNNITKRAVPELECIMLHLGKSRVMWPDEFKRGDKPLCRSIDGKIKVEGIGDGICAKCRYSQWGDNNEKPKCNLNYVWLGADQMGQPFRLTVRGSSMTPTKDFFNSLLPMLSRGGKHLGIFIFKMMLTSYKDSNDKGTYQVMKYDITGTIDKSKYAELEGMSASLRELFMKAIDYDTLTIDTVEDVEDMDDDAGDSGRTVLF